LANDRVFTNETGLSAYIFVCCLAQALMAVVGIPAFLLVLQKKVTGFGYLISGFLGLPVPAATP
jgi:hypothetical protein